MCAGENLQRYIVEHGIEYARLDDGVMHLAAANEILERSPGVSRARKSLRAGSRLVGGFGSAVRRMVDSAWEAVQDADGIVYRPHGTGGHLLAAKLEVPSFLVEPAPFVTPTREFPHFLMPRLRLGRWYDRLTYRLFDLATLPLHRALHRAVAELPGVPAGTAGEHFVVLNTFSPEVVPRPRDWPEWAVLTGWLFVPARADWVPPQELVEFLDAGPPPIYVGFGSMVRDAKRTTEIVLSVVRSSSQRFVLATGWGGLAPDAVPGNAIVVRSVPHEWLFPRVAAVVHHAGAGTVGNGLRAGKPTVCCPFLGDHYFWSDAVSRIGAGPPPIPLHRLTVERLAAAIRIVTTDEAMRERVRRLGEKLRREDGVARAVEIIRERLAGAGLRRAGSAGG
jgi:sterol 3beta-glucosyltransferase